MKKIIILIYLLLSAAILHAQTGYSARGMGMAGAYQGMARGADVARWNPANLGLAGNPQISVDFLSAALSLGNNSLNLQLYNDYFSQEYFEANGDWDDAAKSEILSYFPSGGFQGFNRLQVTALAISYKEYALAVNSFAYGDLRLPQEFFSIPLEGLGTEQVNLTDIDGEAAIGTEIAFSTARQIDLGWDKIQAFSVGGTLRYLIGLAYADVVEAQGSLLSNEDSIALDGTYRAVLAGMFAEEGDMGGGIGLDLGAAAQVNDRLALGLTFSNLLGSMRFGQVEESQGSFSFHQPGLNVDEFGNFGEYMDSVAVSEDTSFSSGAGVSYTLPKALVLSGTYRAWDRLAVELDYHQGLNNTAGGTTTPRLALGTEYRYYSFLPMRFGFALGGVQGSTLACGFGLDLKNYQLDLAIANQRGFFNQSKGLNFALSQRLTF